MVNRTALLASLALAMIVLIVPAVQSQDRFTDNGDGTVTDHELNLMWSKTDNDGDVDWKQAERWVLYTFPDTLVKKYPNWRLPTLEELKTLYVRDPAYEGYETVCGQQRQDRPSDPHQLRLGMDIGRGVDNGGGVQLPARDSLHRPHGPQAGLPRPAGKRAEVVFSLTRPRCRIYIRCRKPYG